MVRFKVSRPLKFLAGSGDDNEEKQRQFLEFVMKSTNELLMQQDGDDDDDDDSIIKVDVHLAAIKLWSPRDKSNKLLHGENSCTQRLYHYLLSLRWLPDGQALERWWIETSVCKLGSHTNRSSERPPSDSLKYMKHLLKSAESVRLDRSDMTMKDSDDDKDNLQHHAVRRFGALGGKKRRAWHNFAADPRNEERGRSDFSIVICLRFAVGDC